MDFVNCVFTCELDAKASVVWNRPDYTGWTLLESNAIAACVAHMHELASFKIKLKQLPIRADSGQPLACDCGPLSMLPHLPISFALLNNFVSLVKLSS